jgi:hypothetical protein
MFCMIHRRGSPSRNVGEGGKEIITEPMVKEKAGVYSILVFLTGRRRTNMLAITEPRVILIVGDPASDFEI